jgi:hypothetical protein
MRKTGAEGNERFSLSEGNGCGVENECGWGVGLNIVNAERGIDMLI